MWDLNSLVDITRSYYQQFSQLSVLRGSTFHPDTMYTHFMRDSDDAHFI